MATRCDARHTKNLQSMAEMNLQQAATKLVSKEEIALNIASCGCCCASLFCSIVAKASSI